MIHYAEISTEHQTTQMLTVGRSGAPEHVGGSKSVSLAVAARQNCGAAGSGDERLYSTATFSEALLRANTPIKTSASLSRAPVCDATNTLVENDPNFSAVNTGAIYLSETIIPIHTALLI